MQAFFELLRQTLKHADRTSLPPITKTLFAFFLQVFDLRHHLQIRQFDQGVINGIEESAIGSFLELVTKMNEVGFKPLWGRLVDWGVLELGEGKGECMNRLIGKEADESRYR
jgi:U3 small nucleolar RNA-associated protein 10